MHLSHNKPYNDQWGAPQERQYSIPRGDLLFIDRKVDRDKIQKTADRQNAETLANPPSAEMAVPSTVTLRTGEIAVVTTVEVGDIL